MARSFKSRFVSLLVLLSILLSSCITVSVAWLSAILKAQTDGDFAGSSMVSYFAGGDGTKTNPYIISSARHLYNLSWLQNMGFFDEKHPYFKVADANGNATTINMAGQLSSDGVSGAIPPIGSINKPFKGEFNGNGSIIENLWVSTDPADWKRMPQGLEADFDTSAEKDYVGLFGAISDTAIIYNFKLDKIEVKTHIDATVGIICGYVDAMVFNVGVYNGIITATDGAVLASDYSILGAKSSRIVWEDMPEVKLEYGGGGGEGGVIRVDVNDGKLTNLFTNNALAATYKDIHDAVEDAMPKRSYLVGDITKTTQNKDPVFYIYSTRINSSKGYATVNGKSQKVIETNNDKGNITSPTANTFLKITAGSGNQNSTYYTALHSSTSDIIKNNLTYNADFDTRINNLTKTRILLQTGAPPSFDMTSEGWENNFAKIQFAGATEELYVPKNGVWFKPMAPGSSIISFTITNSSEDAHRSIYRYTRYKDGEKKGQIDPSSVTETVFVLNVNKQLHNNNKNACFTNGDILAFEFMIDQDDIDGGYEFIIGNSSDYGDEDSRSGFLFLALAGASNKDGPTTDSDGNPIFRQALYDVDYVVSLEDDMTAEEYKIHQSILRINPYTAPTGSQISLYYLAKAVQNDAAGFASRVFYYVPADDKIVDITVQEQSQRSPTKFDDRATVANDSG
ncbi:MAG: hypothetical protein J6V09_01745 [Clostridia bacterium]|nr:hypothetical protein [Clostridia bacterium]